MSNIFLGGRHPRKAKPNGSLGEMWLSYSSYYNSVQSSIVQKYLAMGSEEAARHAPIISNLLTEELLKTELMTYLPSGLFISKGEVIKKDKSSGDCDLIIYKKPVIYQYGSIVIVPSENVKAIIDVELHGERFLKSFLSQTEKLSKRNIRKKKATAKLKDFTENIICVGLHGHANTDIFKQWYERKNQESIPIFIFYTKHDRKIVKGEFERLIQHIQKLQ